MTQSTGTIPINLQVVTKDYNVSQGQAYGYKTLISESKTISLTPPYEIPPATSEVDMVFQIWQSLKQKGEQPVYIQVEKGLEVVDSYQRITQYWVTAFMVHQTGVMNAALVEKAVVMPFVIAAVPISMLIFVGMILGAAIVILVTIYYIGQIAGPVGVGMVLLVPILIAVAIPIGMIIFGRKKSLKEYLPSKYA